MSPISQGVGLRAGPSRITLSWTKNRCRESWAGETVDRRSVRKEPVLAALKITLSGGWRACYYKFQDMMSLD